MCDDTTSSNVACSADPSEDLCPSCGWVAFVSSSINVLREASLSLDLVLMPGMESFTSALRTSGVRLCVRISQSTGLGAMMLDCFLFLLLR